MKAKINIFKAIEQAILSQIGGEEENLVTVTHEVSYDKYTFSNEDGWEWRRALQALDLIREVLTRWFDFEDNLKVSLECNAEKEEIAIYVSEGV